MVQREEAVKSAEEEFEMQASSLPSPNCVCTLSIHAVDDRVKTSHATVQGADLSGIIKHPPEDLKKCVSRGLACPLCA